jgi:hypothetical protein
MIQNFDMSCLHMSRVVWGSTALGPPAPALTLRLLLQRCGFEHGRSRPRGRRLTASAAAADVGGAASSGGEAASGPPLGQRLLAFQQAFWKFLRPHTIRGTILGSIAVTARALIESPVVCLSAVQHICFQRRQRCVSDQARAHELVLKTAW